MHRSTRVWLALLLLFIFRSSAAQCIGVVTAGGGNQFWEEVGRGAKSAGAHLGVDIYFRGPLDEMHPEAQHKIIEAVRKQNCRAIVIAPSSSAINAQVEQFRQQGIPAVYIDRDPGGAAIQAFVGTDNFKAGTRAGLIMADKLHGRGTVLLFRMQDEVASTRDRERGFLEAARASGLRVIVGPYIGSDIGAARVRAANLLSSLAEPVNGVFTPNESVTLAVLSALRGEAGLLARHELVFIGFDINDELTRAVIRGQISALFVQHPWLIGYQGVIAAYHAAANDPASPMVRVDTGVNVIYRSDLIPH